MPKSKVDVRARQAPIRQRYRDDPDSVPEVLRVQGGSGDLADPLHCVVIPESLPDAAFRCGAHPAVGGDGDVPCSADLLLAALAACQETTLRMVAANMGIDLEQLGSRSTETGTRVARWRWARSSRSASPPCAPTRASWSAGTNAESAPSGCCAAPSATASFSARCARGSRSSPPLRWRACSQDLRG